MPVYFLIVSFDEVYQRLKFCGCCFLCPVLSAYMPFLSLGCEFLEGKNINIFLSCAPASSMALMFLEVGKKKHIFSFLSSISLRNHPQLLLFSPADTGEAQLFHIHP